MKNTKLKAYSMTNHTAELYPIDKPKEKVIALERAASRAFRFTKISDLVAQSDHWCRNEPIPFGLEFFPHEWFMRYSDLFYPSAKGGKLYIDTPMSATEIMYCERKLKAYHSKGVRYTYIISNEDAESVLMRLDPILPNGRINLSDTDNVKGAMA